MFNFFQKRSLGLNISDYSIKIISLEGPFEKPRLLAVGRQVLKIGIIEDGKILQKGKLETSLKNLIENPQFRQIKTKKLIFSFPESKSFIHVFRVPNILQKETMREEVRLQAAQNFPFPLKDLYLDFKIKNKEILLVAFQKDIIEGYLEIFKKIKLQPIALETESLSLARALIGREEEIMLIADIGARTTNFSIFDGRSLRLSIAIDIAGNQFTQVLAEKLNISSSRAENLKKEIGLDPEKKEGKVFLTLQKEIQKIISEINKINEYFREKEGKSFEKIILAGGSALGKNRYYNSKGKRISQRSSQS